MASKTILNFDMLLAPISESDPTGVDVREDPGSRYRDLKNLAMEARRLEKPAMPAPAGEKKQQLEKPDWDGVVTLAEEILAKQSKDLEVTALLIEALLNSQGFAGLRDGFRLARELIEKYWDDLYPKPDEDGVATRVFGLSGLNGVTKDGVLIAPIRKINLTGGNSEDSFAYWQYEQFKSAGDSSGMERIEQAVALSDVQFLRTMREDLDQCRDEFSGLCAGLKAKCEKDAPPSSNIFNVLEAFRNTLGKLTKENETSQAALEDDDAGQQGMAGDKGDLAQGTISIKGKPQNREEAFRTLEGVADFFQRKEPHSPISYLLKQAVRWGRMPLPELITELITDEKVREQYSKLTGVRPDSK